MPKPSKTIGNLKRSIVVWRLDSNNPAILCNFVKTPEGVAFGCDLSQDVHGSKQSNQWLLHEVVYTDKYNWYTVYIYVYIHLYEKYIVLYLYMDDALIQHTSKAAV